MSGEVSDRELLSNVAKGNYRLVFFSPEMIIGTRRWRKVIGGDVWNERLKAVVVDEAHCVKKNGMCEYLINFNLALIFLFRGDTFRTVLAKIGDLRSLIPIVQCT